MNASFLHMVGQLKSTVRTGWTRFGGIPRIESVADHSWRMAMMCLCAPASLGLDRDRCMRIALVHDLAEAVCGDMVLVDDLANKSDAAHILSIGSKDEKRRIEQAAMDRILACADATADGDALRRELMALWMEYEEQATAEARYVKECDKLEMGLQAHEYMAAGSASLDEFLASIRGKIATPALLAVESAIDPGC